MPPSTTLSDPLIAQQWHHAAINVFPIWEDYGGEGVIVGVADDGIDAGHPDLDHNYDGSLAFNYRDGLPSGTPVDTDDNHGTAVAGLIAAEGDNGVGGAGVAHQATVTSLQFLPTGYIPEVFQDAVAVDVLNNSWGYRSPFYDNFLSPTFAATQATLADLVSDGRGGLGTVVVFSAGNSRAAGENVNYHNHGNSRFTISVAASDQDGEITYYSTPGAASLVTAPGGVGDIVTTDRVGEAGYADGNITYGFAGTSASAPLVSGVVALMLEANPLLGYRDVQEILAYSARASGSSDWTTNGADNWNGGGLHVSHDFGFGIVDAHAAVRLAESWNAQSTAANEIVATNARGYGAGLTIADNQSLQVGLAMPAIEVEHVEVVLQLEHSFLNDLVVTLTSPDGTESLLADRPPTVGDGSLTFRFDSVRHWGETSAGTWTLAIEDRVDYDEGLLLGWQLSLFGDPTSANDRYVFTDEYADYADLGSRTHLTDGGGRDVFNAAAVTTDSVIELRPGGTGQIAGKPVSIGAATRIEMAFGGDGDDVLGGNAAANQLTGGRGDDVLFGRRGDDLLCGGDHDDRLFGGGGRDQLRAATGEDYLAGGRGDDWLRGGRGADRLFGDQGEDHLFGGISTDRLHGGGGRDTIAGGAGQDRLSGDRGADLLIGGAGGDQLAGGGGSDRFLYLSPEHGGDVILDFTPGVGGDRLLIGDLLEGFVEGRSDPDAFVSLSTSDDGTVVYVSVDGGSDDPVALATLQGAFGLSVENLVADGNLGFGSAPPVA